MAIEPTNPAPKKRARARAGKQGLRVSVSLHGTVVAQTVHWPRTGGLPIGISPKDPIPTPSGGPLAWVRWRSPDEVQIRPLVDGAEHAALRQGDSWLWSNGQGVDVALDLVTRQPARRRPDHFGGDVALLTLMLMLTVGMAQARTLGQWLFPQTGVHVDTATEVSPELIARLLEKDFDGAAEGLNLLAERPDHTNEARSTYLPAGNQGLLERAGGGRNMGEDPSRLSPSEGDGVAAVHPADTPPGLEEANSDIDQELLPGTDGFADATTGADDDSPFRPDPVEQFVGWGFRDWLDVADARPSAMDRIAQHLRHARRKLAIDPDDPHSIQVLGYYAYLSENQEMCREAYERYIELYPEDPAGYNNLALTYKRTHDYEQEEALYRRALDLNPLDTHVLNNLAVNLAHQDRHEEGLRIMALLAALDPEDPYSDLHRAKIYAAMGKRNRAYTHLRLALEGIKDLDTLHHIEFRQDIRLDPAFASMRKERRFRRVLRQYYGVDAEPLLADASDAMLEDLDG